MYYNVIATGGMRRCYILAYYQVAGMKYEAEERYTTHMLTSLTLLPTLLLPLRLKWIRTPNARPRPKIYFGLPSHDGNTTVLQV